LSASESFFMEALYESGRFPCLFVGGSAGGKSDFKKTLIHDGKRSYQNHAQIVFIKTAPDIRFGVFKSQNFKPAGLTLSVLTASVEDRTIDQVIDSQGNIMSMVQALCNAFSCDAQALEKNLADYSFAIRVGDELFVRSIARIDHAQQIIQLFCDVAPGEELVMVKRTPLREATRRFHEERFGCRQPVEHHIGEGVAMIDACGHLSAPDVADQLFNALAHLHSLAAAAYVFAFQRHHHHLGRGNHASFEQLQDDAIPAISGGAVQAARTVAQLARGGAQAESAVGEALLDARGDLVDVQMRRDKTCHQNGN
nr:hypothetical protein [Tanacetum cinerariifolium]